MTSHFIYLRMRKSTMVGQIHRFLGCGIIVLAIVNAGVGWNFAGNPGDNLPYGITAAVVGAVFIALLGIVLRLQRKRSYKAERESFMPQDYKTDPPAEYEMHNGAVAPRTPRWMESNDSLRPNAAAVYTDSDSKHQATAQWQSVAGP